MVATRMINISTSVSVSFFILIFLLNFIFRFLHVNFLRQDKMPENLKNISFSERWVLFIQWYFILNEPFLSSLV